MASIARKNLIEDFPRFLVAQAGILFAVSLVTLQTGLYNGFARSSSQLIEQSSADIWIASETMVHLGLTLPVPYERRQQAAAVAGVDRVEALIVNGADWRDRNNQLSGLTMIGSEPNGELFIPWNVIQGTVGSLRKPYSVIVDQSGLESLNALGLGDAGTIGSRPARITGLTEGTKSLVLGNLMFTSLSTARAYLTSPPEARLPCGLAGNGVACSPVTYPSTPLGLAPDDPVTFVLVRAELGQNVQTLKQRLDNVLPNTRAYTKAEMMRLNQAYWQERSGIGFVLGLGAVVGIIVGVVVVGQILYSSISEHMKEFGTLKAMGASNWVIYGVIGEQALWMSVLGYVPGMALSLGVATWASATQGILILITPISAVSIFGITVLMCLSASLFAIQKVTRVDPAIVFKS
jgi:putative ABC transport system permease protein